MGGELRHVPAVVVSGHTMALGVVRALGREGIPVIVMHHDARDMAHRSRYATAAYEVRPPHTAEPQFIDDLQRHGAALRGALLVPASDEAVTAVSRHKVLLSRDYVVACPDWEVTRGFIEKRRTYAIAAAAGVATPVTYDVRSAADARRAAAHLGYPLLVKPSQSHLFFDRFKRKMAVVRTGDELDAQVRAALGAGLEVIVQEIVPGADSEVVNYNAYAWGGRSLVEFTGRQIRKAPPRFGSPRVVRSERIDAVLEPGRAVLRALGFEGFACTEFKRDPRDGRYKLLDVNGRHNLSGLLAVRCGVNFPLLEYRHRILGELPRATPFQEGVYWVDVFRDAAYSVANLFAEHRPPWEYVRPYVGPHCDAIFDRRDPGPFVARALYLGRALLHVAPRAPAPVMGD